MKDNTVTAIIFGAFLFYLFTGIASYQEGFEMGKLQARHEFSLQLSAEQNAVINHHAVSVTP